MKKTFAAAMAALLIAASLGAQAGAGAGRPPAKAVIKEGIQYVSVEVTPRAYGNIVVQKGIPVRFNLHAAKGSLNGCNGTVQFPAFGLNKRLAPGDNLVEFLPKKAGTLGYACWMNMIGSSIIVVDDLAAWGKK